MLFKKYIYLFQTHENCKTIEAILYNETYVSKTLWKDNEAYIIYNKFIDYIKLDYIE